MSRLIEELKAIAEASPQYKHIIDKAVEALKEREWVPIRYHVLTEEEIQEEGYPEDLVYMLDCPMPDDEQEILITIKSKRGNYVEKDVCYIEDVYSLDSGHDWITDVVAWMPLPEPYKAESEEEYGLAYTSK